MAVADAIHPGFGFCPERAFAEALLGAWVGRAAARLMRALGDKAAALAWKWCRVRCCPLRRDPVGQTARAEAKRSAADPCQADAAAGTVMPWWHRCLDERRLAALARGGHRIS